MFAEVLQRRISPIVQLSVYQIHQLENHYNLLLKWSKVLNLTSIHGLEEIVDRHYCESIFLAVHLPPGALTIADIGSGAGFPGVPVAVVRSEYRISLIESHRRKSVFLRESTRKLTNIEVLTDRVENVVGKFEWAICRAVQFEGIEKSVSKLSKRVAILGTEQPSGSRFTWNNAIQLPWGHQRYLWLGTLRST